MIEDRERSVTISLAGEPVAWARTRLGKRGVPFTPERQRNNTAAFRVLAQQAMDGQAPFDCPVRLDLQAEFAIPSTWSQRKQAAAMRGEIRPAKRPDLSNVVKQVEDACNGVVFRDDALIVEYGSLRKIYSVAPKVVVTVTPLLDGAPATEFLLSEKAHEMDPGGNPPADGTGAPGRSVAHHRG